MNAAELIERIETDPGLCRILQVAHNHSNEIDSRDAIAAALLTALPECAVLWWRRK